MTIICTKTDTGRLFGNGYFSSSYAWWDEGNSNTIHLSAIDVDKTELKYKGEQNFGSKENAASGRYDVVIFSAATTVTSDEIVDFPNAMREIVSTILAC